jgi:hypothetical protein
MEACGAAIKSLNSLRTILLTLVVPTMSAWTFLIGSNSVLGGAPRCLTPTRGTAVIMTALSTHRRYP